jgi:DNA primase
MSFPPEFIDELRARVSLASIAGQRVTFDPKKSNPRKRDYWACCPFHAEKTPSFHVDDVKGFYHCFGCGVSGDAIGFLMAIDNLTFVEAVERLAESAGLPLPKRDPKREAAEAQRGAIAEALEAAQKFFVAVLHGQDGAEARAYLTARGCGPALWRSFELGFAPASRTALFDHLKRAGYKPTLLAEAGLVVTDDERAPYDRFRGRVIFPIRDARGRLSGFGGRTLSRDPEVPKYLNSPETPLFRKGRLLFNLHAAQRAARAAGTLVVAEGYMDVIALHGAGIAHAVAPLGTALTEHQLALLWQVAAEPILCFDGDEAGRRAAARVAQLALPHVRPGRSLRFAIMPEGADPDDLLRRHGRAAMEACLVRTDALIDFLWEHEVQAQPHDKPEQRAALEERLRALVQRIAEPAVRSHYGRDFNERLRALFGFGASGAMGRRPTQPPGASPGLKRTSLARVGQDVTALPPGFLLEVEAALLAALIERPALLERLGEVLTEIAFSAPELDKISNELIDLTSRGESLDSPSLKGHLTNCGAFDAATGLFAREVVRKMSASWAGLAVDEAERQWRRAAERLKRGRELRADLDQATLDLSKAEDEVARVHLQMLQREWQALITETLAP